MKRADLHQDRKPKAKLIENDEAAPFVEMFSKRKLQVLETFEKSPLYCASPVRLSDVVMILKRDHGVDIVTTYHTEVGVPDPATFGVYALKSRISNATADMVVAS